MIKLLFLCFVSLVYSQTELYILGSVHVPSPQLNSDSIVKLFNKIKPDLILLESDHSNFNDDFTFKRTFDENEWNAAVEFKKSNPKVKFRPFEIEGRNSIRVELGIEGHNPIFNTIYDLYDQHQLSPSQAEIWARFVLLADSLDLVGKKSLRVINNAITDNLVIERQFYQYYKVREIVNSHPYFETMVIKKSKKTHSGRSFFNSYADFELKRNHEMVQNILTQMRAVNAKKIVVITGFYHRPFLLNALVHYQTKYNFNITPVF